jgi:hypothetical protein
MFNMETVDAYQLGLHMHAALRRRAGMNEAQWNKVLQSGRITGSKLLASQSGVSLRTLGRALRAKPESGSRIRLNQADMLLIAAGYGPETLDSLAPQQLPGWAYGLSDGCSHVDPAWGI